MITDQPDFETGTLNPYVIQPNEIQSGYRLGYKVVAVALIGWNGWAAYRGPTGWSDQQVAENGDALSQSEAEAIFPAMARTGRVYSA